MTCIVGIKKGGVVYMGGDSIQIDSKDDVGITVHPKVFKVGDFLVGSCGGVRQRQLMQYTFRPALTGDNYVSDMDYMVRAFIPGLQRCFKEGDYDPGENGPTFLVGFKGHIYIVGPGFHVLEFENDYVALGTGQPYACGSLHTTDANLSEWTPEDRIRKALSAAEHHNAGVRGPFTIISSAEDQD